MGESDQRQPQRPAAPLTAAALLAALPPVGVHAADRPAQAAPLPPLPELLQLLTRANDLALAFAQERPEVQNVAKLARRIQQNARYVKSQIAAQEAPAAPTSPTPAGAAGAAAPAGAGPTGPAASAVAALEPDSRVQGIVNNIRGLVSELQAMFEAPGVTAVVKRFRASPPGGGGGGGAPGARGSGGEGGSCSGGGGGDGGLVQPGGPVGKCSSTCRSPAAVSGSPNGSPGAGPVNRGVSVEVDVVAHGGQTWIEVKGGQVFGLGSSRWAGQQGLKGQVEALVAAARAPGAAVRFRPPQVVVFCPFGADPEVVAELSAMGARAAVGIGSLAALPEPYPPPALTNLDTTTLCALVSEVSHRPPLDEALTRWARRTWHWQDCLAAEAARPLLDVLQPHIGRPGQTLIAAAAAVSQFERLLADFGGPCEARRWREELKPRLLVFSTRTGNRDGGRSDSGGSGGCCGGGSGGSGAQEETARVCTSRAGAPADGAVARCTGTDTHPAGGSNPSGGGTSSSVHGSGAACASGGAPGQEWGAQPVFSVPPAVAGLRLVPHQADIFGLGAALEALTLTANSNAARFAAECAVALEVVVHRPVWLTGL